MNRAFLLMLVIALPALGQSISGSLSGTVQDASGAAFAGAEVKLFGTETGFVRTAATNMEGFFSFPELTPGKFTLEISGQGFKQYRQENIPINSGDSRSTGAIRMEIGAVTETVTVSAESTAVSLGGSERVAVLDKEDLQDLALRGRDFMDAIGLLPGVVDTNESREAPNANSPAGIYIAGGRENSKNITIDGVSNLDTGSANAVHNMPSMDSIAEVSVKMSNYGAENGRNSGGAINILTRGGGARFHGGAGWYHRHENFNANNFFNNKQDLQRPPYRYHIFSYNVGGPVLLPGTVYNKDRNKLFFFFSQEFQRQLQASGTTTVRVPTALERAGDFSQSFDVNGRVIAVRDPLVGNTPGTQFPGNKVPASRFHPTGQAILNLFPMPNFVDPDPSRVHQWNYIAQRSGPYPRHTEIVRTDFSPRPNLQMYLRIANNADTIIQPFNKRGLSWIAGDMNFPLTPIHYDRGGRGVIVSTTATLSPTLVNDFKFGVSGNEIHFFPENPDAVSREKTGINIPQWNPGVNPSGFIPDMSFSSVPNYANPSMYTTIPYYTDNTIISFTENLTKIWGTHTSMAGVYIERMLRGLDSAGPVRGDINFNRNQNINPLDTNYAWATALLGYYNSYQEANASLTAHYRYTNFEFYVKDQWHILPNLTIDCGVRFYHDMPQYDARQQLSAFVPSLYNPAQSAVLLRPGYDSKGTKVAVNPITGATYSQGLIGTFAPGIGNPSNGMATEGKGLPRGGYTMPAISYAPRFGFSWDPFKRALTRIHGGAGVYFDRIAGNPTFPMLSNPPSLFSPTVYYGTIEALAATAGRGILGPTAVRSISGEAEAPTVYNFSFGIQHQIGRAAMVDVSYVGALSRHLLWLRNINAVPVGARFLDEHPENRDPTTANTPLADNFLRPYQGYGNINLNEFASSSNYHSLQLRAVRRMARGFQVQASYTFGKALGTASADGSSINIFGLSPRDYDYGPLDFDRSHVFSASYSYVMPKLGRALGSKALGMVADGWQLSGITRMQTGAPFTPGWTFITGQTNVTGTPTQNARIAVLDPNAPLTQRFRPPDRSRFGEAGKSVLRLPGINNWDLSLYRNVIIQERYKLQLRWETYNTFNHTQFSNVSRQAAFQSAADWAQTDPLFLQPTAARAARTMQVALRLTF